MPDLSAMTDEQLADHLNAVLAEQERRARLANTPARVASLAAAYARDGGDPADLVTAIQTPTPEGENS